MTNINEILQDKIRLYDQENGTELARFVAFLERGKVYEGNEARFFHVGKTGELLQKYGMKGDVTIGRSAFSQRHTAVGHKLDDNDWIKVIKNINNHNNRIFIIITNNFNRNYYNTINSK